MNNGERPKQTTFSMFFFLILNIDNQLYWSLYLNFSQIFVALHL